MTSFSYLPLLALAAAFFLLVYIAFAGVRRRMLSVQSRTLLLIAAAVLLIATVPLTIRSISTPHEKKLYVTTRKFSVVLEFSIHQSNAEVVQVPFTSGSGSVNIGCEETRSVTVQYALPPGAEQPAATAQWVNTNNVESQTADVDVGPTDVRAVGSISGLHRTFLFNCPGGGHGELLLRGQYSVKHEFPATPIVIKTLRDVAESGKIFTAALPQVANSQPVSFAAMISDASPSSSVEGTIMPGEKGGYELRITSRNGALPHDIKIVGQTFVMTL